jgi:hypothetical protein
MPSPLNTTNITPPRVPLIDERTGLISREWYRFFLNIFQLTGSGTNTASLTDLQLGPPVTQENIAEIENKVAGFDLQPRVELGTMSQLQQANVPWMTFDTTPEHVPPDVGTVAWDGGTTLGVQATSNVLIRVGESEYVYAKASAAITKGQLCYHTGSVGSSGVITVAPTPLALADPNQIVGVAAETLALNNFGLIQISGDLRGFNTTGSSVGETWADGDPLYYNPSFVGSLTKNKPSAPSQKSYIGEVISAGAGSSGSMHIRIVPGSILGGTDSNVQFSALVNGDLIQYDSVLQYWKNVPASTLSVGTATNLAGGATGSVPYQSAASTTTFLPIGTALQVLKVNAGATAPQWVSGAALTKVDDTNVTLTLGGTPATSLLAATSLTLGWTGQLATSRGGTGTATTFTAGSVVFAGASGVYSQDNSNFFWDAANVRLGIDTATPTCTLDVMGGIQTSRTGVTTPATTDGNVFSGTYTPSLTNVTNVAASTATICQYMRVGNVITVSGQVSVDPTATGNTEFRMSLPVASNFASTRQVGGTFFGQDTGSTQTGVILASSTNDQFIFRYVANDTANRILQFHVTYLVI